MPSSPVTDCPVEADLLSKMTIIDLMAEIPDLCFVKLIWSVSYGRLWMRQRQTVGQVVLL